MVKKKARPELFNKDYQKNWSETHRYKHIHTGEYCTFEAYVAELLVLRRAEKMKLPRPGYKFWTKGDPNHWLWMKQFNAARALKKKYSEETILKAINSREFEKLLVIGIQNGRGWKINPLAEKVILMYHKKMEEEKNRPQPQEIDIVQEVEEVRTRRTQSIVKKKSMINKLRDL
jgi:hypothetical protein